MKSTIVIVDASRLVKQVADTTAPALRQVDCRRCPIVEILPSGRIEIVDGYHRVAGMIAAGETIINCVTCDDADVLADAANPEDTAKQHAAIELIYGSV